MPLTRYIYEVNTTNCTRNTVNNTNNRTNNRTNSHLSEIQENTNSRVSGVFELVDLLKEFHQEGI